jgi:hypothetical protein
MELTKEFFFDLEKRLRAEKWDPKFDLIRDRLLKKEPLSADEFAREAIWVVLAGGFKQKTAKVIYGNVIDYIENHTAQNGEQMTAGLLEIFGHKNKIKAVVKIWQNRQTYRAGYYNINRENINEKMYYLQSLPHIGPITKNHLARNLGENVPKYDIHIQRLGVAVKEQTDKNKAQLLKDKIDNANLHSEIKQICDEMFTCLEHETGLPRGWIDWKTGSIPRSLLRRIYHR